MNFYHSVLIHLPHYPQPGFHGKKPAPADSSTGSKVSAGSGSPNRAWCQDFRAAAPPLGQVTTGGGKLALLKSQSLRKREERGQRKEAIYQSTLKLDNLAYDRPFWWAPYWWLSTSEGLHWNSSAVRITDWLLEAASFWSLNLKSCL